MSTFGQNQWGNTYRFRNGDTTIGIGTHLHIDSSKGVRESTIDSMLLLSVVGNKETAARMFLRLQKLYVGHSIEALEAVAIPAVHLDLGEEDNADK